MTYQCVSIGGAIAKWVRRRHEYQQASGSNPNSPTRLTQPRTIDAGGEMSSSLISMVTLGSAERPGHLPPMYGNALYVRADGLTPKISNGPNARSRLWPNLDLFLACFCNENASMNLHKYMYLFLGNIFIPPLQKWTAHRSRRAMVFTIVCQ